MSIQMRQLDLKVRALALAVAASAAILLGCTAPMHSPSPDGNSNLSSEALSSPEAFAEFTGHLHVLLVNNCSRCHGVNQTPLFAVSDPAVSQDTLLRLGLVSLSSPASSRIVAKINSGHQGFTPALATSVQSAIANWATLVNAAAASGGGSVLPAPEPLAPTFKSISERILSPKCVACHGSTSPSGDFRYDSYSETLKSVNASAPLESKLYTEVLSGSMPTGVGSLPLSNEEVAILAEWLQAGAPNN